MELELAQRKIYELELIKTELYNSKLELEARLNQVFFVKGVIEVNCGE